MKILNKCDFEMNVTEYYSKLKLTMNMTINRILNVFQLIDKGS